MYWPLVHPPAHSVNQPNVRCKIVDTTFNELLHVSVFYNMKYLYHLNDSELRALIWKDSYQHTRTLMLRKCRLQNNKNSFFLNHYFWSLLFVTKNLNPEQIASQADIFTTVCQEVNRCRDKNARMWSVWTAWNKWKKLVWLSFVGWSFLQGGSIELALYVNNTVINDQLWI